MKIKLLNKIQIIMNLKQNVLIKYSIRNINKKEKHKYNYLTIKKKYKYQIIKKNYKYQIIKKKYNYQIMILKEQKQQNKLKLNNQNQTY